jgi:hypothetical protein
MFETEREELAAATRQRLAQHVENRRKAYEALAASLPMPTTPGPRSNFLDNALQDQADHEAGSGSCSQ